MVDMERVNLPGVGVLHRFSPEEGGRIQVISHRSGYSELCVSTESDDDCAEDDSVQLRLGPDEAHSLAELLGGTQITESLGALNALPGLAIDWYKVGYEDFVAGKFLDDPRNIGISSLVIVALLRSGVAEPVPSSCFQVFPGDTLILAGDPTKVAKSFTYFSTGELPEYDSKSDLLSRGEAASDPDLGGNRSPDS